MRWWGLLIKSHVTHDTQLPQVPLMEDANYIDCIAL